MSGIILCSLLHFLPVYAATDPPTQPSKGHLWIRLQYKFKQNTPSSRWREHVIQTPGGFATAWGPYIKGTNNPPPGKTIRVVKGKEDTDQPGIIKFYNLDANPNWEWQIVQWGHKNYQPLGGYYIYTIGDKTYQNVKIPPRFIITAGKTITDVYMSGEHALTRKPQPVPLPQVPGGTVNIPQNLTVSIPKKIPEPGPPAFTIAILSDEGSVIEANKIEPYMRTVYPYSAMGDQLKIVVVESSKQVMACRQSPDYPKHRQINCDDTFLTVASYLTGAHVVIALTSEAKGGSAELGGFIVHMSSIEGDTGRTATHELGHALAGFGDEYDYTYDEEFKDFCNPPYTYPNIVSITPKKSYKNDGDARKAHSAKIPWYSRISMSTPITSRQIDDGGYRTIELGTVFTRSPEIGLYLSGGCSLWVPSWNSNGDSTIMSEKGDFIPLYYAELLIKAMEAKRGNKITLNAPPPRPARY